jgi:AAA-ATPase Vps4-associated protein 1
VCYKPTTTVLATINTVDFLYTCPGHLTDPGFASAMGESSDGVGGARKMGMSPEEIAKVKEEWEEKQKKKQEKEKARAAEKGKKDESKDGDEQKGKEQKGTDAKPSKPPGSWSPTTTPPAPTHQRFTLQRDYFAS